MGQNQGRQENQNVTALIVTLVKTASVTYRNHILNQKKFIVYTNERELFCYKWFSKKVNWEVCSLIDYRTPRNNLVSLTSFWSFFFWLVQRFGHYLPSSVFSYFLSLINRLNQITDYVGDDTGAHKSNCPLQKSYINWNIRGDSHGFKFADNERVYKYEKSGAAFRNRNNRLNIFGRRSNQQSVVGGKIYTNVEQKNDGFNTSFRSCCIDLWDWR